VRPGRLAGLDRGVGQAIADGQRFFRRMEEFFEEGSVAGQESDRAAD
jgi:hypothetical protein